MIETSGSISMSDHALSVDNASAASSKKFDQSRKRFQRRVAPHLPVLVVDAEGTIQHITPAARRLLEYRHDEDPLPCFFSHIHGRNMYQVMRDVADMVCYGKPRASWLLQLRTARGRWRWVKASVQNHLEGDEPSIHVAISDLQE